VGSCFQHNDGFQHARTKLDMHVVGPDPA
jgi:hypothetical protein